MTVSNRGLYLLVDAAYRALHNLSVEVHYMSCGRGVS
jgi:hypothetical protein